MAQFLACLVLYLFGYPMLQGLYHAEWVRLLVTTIVLLSGVFAVGGGRKELLTSLAIVAPVILVQWGGYMGAVWDSNLVASGAMLIFAIYVASLLFQFILGATAIDLDVLSAGVAIYLLIGLIGMHAYLLVATLSPGSFAEQGQPLTSLTDFEAQYFSFVTLTTLGYGDVVARSQAARALAMAQASLGVLYVTVLIGRMVALFRREGGEPTRPA